MHEELVFDIGCHNGQDSDFYLKKGFSVVAVEANPALCVDLKARFAHEIAAGRFILIDKAIAERAGEVHFYVNSQASIWGTIRGDIAHRKAVEDSHLTEITVPSITFDSLLKEFGVPYYLKIDIEGADLLCLQSFLASEDRPRFVSIESDQDSIAEIHEGLSLLKKLGYTQFQIIDQSTVPEQSPSINHRFDMGATGLFGDELPGTWRSYNSTIMAYLRIIFFNKVHGLSKKLPGCNRLIKRRGSWYDTHARMV